MNVSMKLLAIVTLFLGAPVTAVAQQPGEQLAKVQRQLGGRPEGISGILRTSPAILTFYSSDVEPVFRSALDDARAAKKTIEYYRKNEPDGETDWSLYLQAFQSMQKARKRYQDLLRTKIATRESLLNELLDGGVIKAAQADNVRAVLEQTSELDALSQVEEQLLQQKGDIAKGWKPSIKWPTELSQEFRDEIENAVNDTIDHPGEGVSEPWNVIRKRILKVKRDMEAASDELKEQLRSTDLLNECERRTLTELNILAEAHIDLASTAVLQQATIRAALIAQRTYEIWHRLQ